HTEKRLPLTRFSHHFDKLAQSWNESIVANAKQRTTRNVTHASRFHHAHARSSFSKTTIPVEVTLRDKSIFSRAPRNHRRHPRAAARLTTANSDRAKKT